MVIIGKQALTVRDFDRVIFGNDGVELSDTARQKVLRCFHFLAEFSAGKIIYGINTGFGPMAQYRISDSDQMQLQYNLVRSHSSGMGNALNDQHTKALLLARLNTLSLGFSGVSPQVVDALLLFLQHDLLPIIYEHGSVGASGDLVQLAHLALALIGEGEIRHNGSTMSAKSALQQYQLSPLQLQGRDGLALMNGTSAMTGIGMVNAILAENLVDWSLAASALLNELVQSYSDHFSPELNNTKKHLGQRLVAQAMSDILSDSHCIEHRYEHLYNGKVQSLGSSIEKKVQEYYSLRCVPQVLGPIYDTLQYTIQVLENEVNSVNDNPVVDAEAGDVYHGGNFHGDYVALEMDKLKIAITKLSILSERQLNFLVNHKINGILPPFVNRGVLGLNFGVQGTQFTATSTTAENQMLANPMYVHSIPNNNDNQDIVSMGTNAALMAAKVIENAYQVLAIQWLALVQAVAHLGVENRLSSFTNHIYKQLSQLAPPFVDDTPFFQRNEQLRRFLQKNRLNLLKTKEVKSF